MTKSPLESCALWNMEMTRRSGLLSLACPIAAWRVSRYGLQRRKWRRLA